MTKRLEGRIALVTGGTGQLGRHVVRRFLDEGARVHVPVFAPEERTALEEATGGAPADLSYHEDADMTDPARVEAVFEAIRTQEGHGVEILLNLAGAFSMAPIKETDPDAWHRLWRRNVDTAFLCSRAALPDMKQGGWGRIVNVSAMPAVQRGRAGLSAYGAAKAAVLNLTWALSHEAVEHGVTVNAIVPSIIDTPGNRQAMPDADTRTWVPPSDIAGVLAYLASDEARVVSGATVTLTLG